MTFDIDALDFTKGNGLVTVVTADDVTGVVLMVAHADRDALRLTRETGEMHYTSRTRGLWRKGATSGNLQRVVSLMADCDGDAVLARVVPAGPACHNGTTSCFAADRGSVLDRLGATISARAAQGEETPSYTRRLLSDRNLRLKKIGEEASELVVAVADGEPRRAVEEAADLVYHVMVALRSTGIGFEAVQAELAAREAKAALSARPAR